MKIIEEVLLEEYQRTLCIRKALLDEMAELPKGSLQRKKIKGKEYCYLQYRDGDAVKSMYVREPEVAGYASRIERRKDNAAALKELDQTLRQIERALGKDFINEHTAERIR